MSGTFPILATFLAASIEGVEMMAILVGVGATRGWRLRSSAPPLGSPFSLD